jgi:serine/threonine-protein kinase
MPSNWSNVRFSPDGRRIAFDIRTDQRDVWIYDLERGTSTRLTFNTSDDFAPAWTPDGRGIVFASTRGDKSVSNLYWQRADGTGEPRRLTESGNQQHPISWHPSGNLLAFMEQLPKTGYDVMLLPIDNTDPSGPTGGQPTAFLRTKAAELAPMFSPDGRWIAYTSTESGRGEVYVRPFPGPGGQQQISTGGGGYGTWSRARHELFYNENGRIMVAAYAVEGDAFRAEQPRPWSDGRFAVRAGPNRMYDVHPDGDRFALAPVPTAAASKPDKVVFIFNFFDELRRIAPVRR